MKVQGNPPPHKSAKPKCDFSEDSVELSALEDGWSERADEGGAITKERSRWSFSNLLLWNCPEFLESFPV